MINIPMPASSNHVFRRQKKQILEGDTRLLGPFGYIAAVPGCSN